MRALNNGDLKIRVFLEVQESIFWFFFFGNGLRGAGAMLRAIAGNISVSGISGNDHVSEALCAFKRHKPRGDFQRPVIKNFRKIVGARLVSNEHEILRRCCWL